MRIEQISRHLLPFLFVLVAVLALVAFVPSITLALPNLIK
jgi:C4-dicarboxylate transporter DctM subunit